MFVPVLPGPPLSFIGILILHLTAFADISAQWLIIMAIIALAVSILDYIAPIWGTIKFGGTRYGIRGATLGLIIGLLFGPAGIIEG